MPRLRPTNGVFLIVALAALGFLLVYVPPKILEQYDRVKELGPPWTYFYLALVGTARPFSGIVCLDRLEAVAGHAPQGRAPQPPGEKPQPALGGRKGTRSRRQSGCCDDLKTKGDLPDDVQRQLQSLVDQVEEKQASQKLEIVAFGTISSGKSSLLNALAGADRLSDRSQRRHDAASAWKFPGPATTACCSSIRPASARSMAPSESPSPRKPPATPTWCCSSSMVRCARANIALLANLGQMEKRILVCLNKADWYEEDAKRLLLGQISAQVKGIVPAEDVVAVRAQPTVRTRVRVLAGGGEQEEQVPVPADISPAGPAHAASRPHQRPRAAAGQSAAALAGAGGGRPAAGGAGAGPEGLGAGRSLYLGRAAPQPRSARCRCSIFSPPAL